MKSFLDWLPRPVFEGEGVTGTGGNDTAPAGDDTAPAGDDLITGDDTASGENDDTLINKEEKSGAFVDEPIAFTEETFMEDIKELIPENFEIDPKGMQEFLTSINGLNSRADIVKFALKTYADYQAATADTAAETWTQTQKEWKEATQAHPEFGGAKLEESRTNAKLVAKTYGGDDFFEMLQLTGTGNHPAMMVFLNRVYAEMPKEGKPVTGSPSPAGEKSLADRLFGAPKEK